MGDPAIKDWLPLGAALIAAVALLVSADLLTVTARLRRKLDKELSIMERLPVGRARRDVTRMCRRHALELAYANGSERLLRRVCIGGCIVYVVCAAGYIAISVTNNVWFPLMDASFFAFLIAAMVFTLTGYWWAGRGRRAYVRHWMDEPGELARRRALRLTPRIRPGDRKPRG